MLLALRVCYNLQRDGAAKSAGPENNGPQNNNSWTMHDLENDGHINITKCCNCK